MESNDSSNPFVFMPTVTKIFWPDVGGEITLQIMNTSDTFCWRLKVDDGSWSEPYFNYRGILIWEGYGVATAYHLPEIEEFVPFRMVYATKRGSVHHETEHTYTEGEGK